MKAVFLDFYGTLVHEDDDILPGIYNQIRLTTALTCTNRDIGSYWWKEFSELCGNAYGPAFQTQRQLGLRSLQKTISYFEAALDAAQVIQRQFDHWRKPEIYADTKPFLNCLSEEMPVYVMSNIDSEDVKAAIEYHGMHVSDVLTSEDVRAYKPRPELFTAALERYRLDPREVIHVGDSLISDVLGAQQLGIDAVWLNRNGKAPRDGITPAYICNNLEEAAEVIIGRQRLGRPIEYEQDVD